MNTSERRPGERVRDVRFTEDVLVVDLLDGRTINERFQFAAQAQQTAPFAAHINVVILLRWWILAGIPNWDFDANVQRRASEERVVGPFCYYKLPPETALRITVQSIRDSELPGGAKRVSASHAGL